MRKLFITAIILTLVGIGVIVFSTQRTTQMNREVVSTSQILFDTERDGLLHMREEEKLARDVYRTLGDVWGLPFTNITESEQRHMDSIKILLDVYQVADPVRDDAVGKFTNPAFTALYASLVERGKQSLADAYVVGALIEELDIADLAERTETTQREDIVRVYGELTRGSRNHLRAFHKNIVATGGTYTPQHITQDLYNEIVTSEVERGRGW